MAASRAGGTAGACRRPTADSWACSAVLFVAAPQAHVSPSAARCQSAAQCVGSRNWRGGCWPADPQPLHAVRCATPLLRCWYRAMSLNGASARATCMRAGPRAVVVCGGPDLRSAGRREAAVNGRLPPPLPAPSSDAQLFGTPRGPEEAPRSPSQGPSPAHRQLPARRTAGVTVGAHHPRRTRPHTALPACAGGAGSEPCRPQPRLETSDSTAASTINALTVQAQARVCRAAALSSTLAAGTPTGWRLGADSRHAALCAVRDPHVLNLLQLLLRGGPEGACRMAGRTVAAPPSHRRSCMRETAGVGAACSGAGADYCALQSSFGCSAAHAACA